MSPSKMLENAIAKGDIDEIKKAHELLKKAKVVQKRKIRGNPPIPPKQKAKSPKPPKPPKVKKVKTDEEYFAEMARIERDRRDKIMKGQAVAVGDNVSLNSDSIMKKESLIKGKNGKMVDEGKLIKKKKSARTREFFESTQKACTKCGSMVEVPNSMLGFYSYIVNANSEKPLFTCTRCG